MIIDYLDWDSNFFKKKIGKVELFKDKSNISDINLDKILKNSDYDLIYFFTDISLDIYNYISVFRPFLIDTQVYLNMNIPSILRKMDYELINNDISDMKNLNSIYEIAEEASEISRFYYDPYLRPYAKKLYRKIIDNSLNKSFGSGIIADSEEEPKGFISLLLSNDLSKELLIAVRKEFNNCGIGRILIKKALSCCHDYGKSEISTIVSAKNINSLNFHIGQGFEIKKIMNVHHLWIPK